MIKRMSQIIIYEDAIRDCFEDFNVLAMHDNLK